MFIRKKRLSAKPKEKAGNRKHRKPEAQEAGSAGSWKRRKCCFPETICQALHGDGVAGGVGIITVVAVAGTVAGGSGSFAL